MISFVETTIADQQLDGWTTLPSITRRLGTCGAVPCPNPAKYVRIVAPMAFVTACEEHACDLASAVGDHSACPKCHMGWIG